jgi:hypothetical protein
MFIHDQALPYFIDLQNRMIDIFPFVSCHENNFDAYSIKIESLFVDVCSFFDSLCQTYICEQHTKDYVFKDEAKVKRFAKKLASVKEPKSTRKKEDFFNTGDYRSLFEGTFRLSDKEVDRKTRSLKTVADHVTRCDRELTCLIEKLALFRGWIRGGSLPMLGGIAPDASL